MTKKTVGIDCRLGGLAHAGIGRYITELVRRITKSTPEIQWVLFCFDSAQAEELVGRNPTKNIKIVYTPIRQYTLKEQYLLPFIFAREKLDLLHVPHFNLPILYTGPVVITIHDLLWHQYRGSDATTLSPFIYWFKYWGYRLVATAAITRAQQIFVPTQTVANTVEQYYQRSSAKILVTKEGIAEELLNKAQTMNTTTRESSCILYVGSLYPHKNIGVVLKALQELPKYRLEIIGSRNVFQDSVRAQVTELGLEKQVTFLGKVSDTTLAQHYAAAELVIQPSFSEGFGLTGLEALAFSTPVVAADTPIFHEVYQTAAEYFDPHSVKDCIRAILTATQEQTWQRLSKQAATVTRQYNWDVLVQKTFAAYTRQLE